jgi:hypothetical protein
VIDRFIAGLAVAILVAIAWRRIRQMQDLARQDTEALRQAARRCSEGEL